MGDSNSNIKIDINAEVSGLKAGLSDATAKLDQLASSFDKHNGAAKQASSHLNAVEASANKLNTVLYGLARKAAGVFLGWKAAELIKDTVLLAARYETLGVSMQVVGNNAGYTSAQMEAAAVGMQNMGISMIESRQQALRMVQANIDLSQSSKLARIAQDAAVIGNMNSSQAFATMIHGIQTGQTDVLRTIGLNISMEQSYKEYAATLGKSASALSQTEKMQAVLNAVMREGEGIAGTYEAAMGTAGKQLNSLARYHENLQVVMGSTFTEALAAAVGAYTGELKDLNTAALELKVQGDLKEWGRAAALTIAAVGDAARMTFNTVGAMATAIERLTVTAAILANPLASGVPRLRALQDDLKKQQAEFTSGMVDNLKLYDAVGAMFDNIDAKAKSSADKRLAIEKDYIAKAQAVAAAYAGTQHQLPALLALADSYGGDIAAGHGSPKTTASGVNTPAKRAADPNAAAVARIQMDAFRAQMDAMGVAAEQVKVYELAMSGANDKQIIAAQSAANLKIELDAQAKVAKEAGKAQEQAAKDAAKAQDEANQQLQRSALEAQAVIYNLDPMFKLQAEWEKLTALKEQGLLTDEQIGKAYQKTFKDISKSGDDAFKSLENAVRGWGNEFTNILATGKGDFSGLIDSMLLDMKRMYIQQSIADPLLEAGKGFLGDIFGGMFGGGSSPASTGATASSWTSTAMPMLPSFAVGTDYVPRDMIAQIHKGERITPAAFNPTNGGGNAAPNIVIQVTNKGQPVSARQQGGPQFDGRDWVIGVVLEAADNNPHFRNAMGMA